MNFAHPGVLYLLLLVPALALALIFSARAAKRALARFGNPELLERAGMAVSGRARLLKASSLLAAVSLLIVALAGPRWGATREKIERKGVDVVIAMDTSKSMLAQDVAPSRLAKSKLAVEKLVDMMRGDRVGLVAYAGAAFTMCPLTLDYGAVKMFLDIIDVNTVPDPGTDIADALRQAGQNFEDETEKFKVIILISDGEDLESEGKDDPVKEAEELADRGVIIYTVGVGETRGASIPVETPGGVVDKVDRSGNVVITRLDEDSLRKIALAGGGKYKRLDNRASGEELADIYKSIAGMEKKTFEEDYRVSYEERFQWFLGAAFILLALELVIPDGRRRK